MLTQLVDERTALRHSLALRRRIDGRILRDLGQQLHVRRLLLASGLRLLVRPQLFLEKLLFRLRHGEVILQRLQLALVREAQHVMMPVVDIVAVVLLVTPPVRLDLALRRKREALLAEILHILATDVVVTLA